MEEVLNEILRAANLITISHPNPLPSRGRGNRSLVFENAHPNMVQYIKLLFKEKDIYE
jgi:hypothetical protein